MLQPQSTDFSGINLEEHTKPNQKKLTKKKKKSLEEKLEQVNQLIAETETNTLNVENEPLKILRGERKKLLRQVRMEEYKDIDLSFLRINSKVDYRYGAISLPKFGVYRYVDYEDELNGFDDFVVEFQFNLWRKAANISFGNQFNDRALYKFQDSVVLLEHLVKTSDFYKAGLEPDIDDCNSWDPSRFISFEKVPRNLAEKMRGKEHGTFDADIRESVFKSEFKGLIPPRIKKKIEEAKEIFGFKEHKYETTTYEKCLWRRYNVFLIAEVDPNSWTHTSPIVNDPLLIGKDEDKFYLIDKFNTTSLEDYVSREFTT